MMRFPESESLMERARKVLPGGVNSPVRSFNSVGGNPFLAQRGKGAYVYDRDGSSFIDLVGSWGPLIHGHSHPYILDRLQKVMQDGLSFGITSEPEIILAEKISKAVPSVEMLRLVNSGTEACMSVIRLARAFTKKNLILKFEGHYHGHADSFLVSAGSGLATLGVSSSSGVDQSQTLVAPFNDRESLKLCFENYGDRIAGVILEVVTGNMGVVLPDLQFLQDLRRLTKAHSSLLIFDEVMTGFRLSMSGAQGVYGIDPDLSCFGKIIGGGLPVGAYGGSKEIMSMISPLGPVYQAGTLSGNPLACTAGLASLELIEKEPLAFYQKLDSAASEWASELRSHIQHHSYPACVVQFGSMFNIFFRPEAPRNFAEAKDSDINRFNRFFWELMKRGVYFPPSAFESCFLSAAHDEDVMSKLTAASIEALDASFSEA